jgi:hypothetical protein
MECQNHCRFSGLLWGPGNSGVLLNDFLDLLGMITDEYRRSHFDFWNNPNMPVQYVFPETVFAVLFLLFFTAFMSDLASRDPILILLPDGLVEFDQQATLVAHMAFTELADIRYQENTDDSNKARLKALELIYNDGFTTIWTPITPTTDAIIFNNGALHARLR